MTPGIYSLVSGLNSRWAQEEVSAKNISGSGVTGYRRQVGAYASFDGILNQSNNELSDRTSAMPLPYSQKTSFDWDTSAPPTHTGAPLDAAISGEGFFQVQSPSGGVKLTRNGHFSVSIDRQLVDGSGLAVIGNNGPITVPAGQAVLHSDGSLSVDGKNIDTLNIVMPEKIDLLTSEDGSHFNLNGSTTKKIETPMLAEGALDTSNISLPHELNTMIQNQRMFDMLTRAVQTTDESVGRAIQDMSS